MRRLLIAAVLAAGTATADESLFMEGDALREAVNRDCKAGCMVLNHEQADALSNALKEIIDRKQHEAYIAGKESERAYGRCRT